MGDPPGRASSKRVGIIAIKNKKNANTLLRDVFTAIAVVVSVDEW